MAVGRGRGVFTRRFAWGVALLLVVVVVGGYVLAWRNGKGEYRCVPSASTMPDLVPTLAVVALGSRVDRDLPPPSAGGCLPERSSYSITAGNGSPLGLTFSYQRTAATWSHHGRTIASQLFADLRPPDATHLEMSAFLVGDEGYLTAATVKGHSKVELAIREVNVLIRVGYLVDQPLPDATATAKALGELMVDELNEYEYNGQGGA